MALLSVLVVAFSTLQAEAAPLPTPQKRSTTSKQSIAKATTNHSSHVRSQTGTAREMFEAAHMYPWPNTSVIMRMLRDAARSSVDGNLDLPPLSRDDKERRDKQRVCMQTTRQGKKRMLSLDEVEYARCPPGKYLSHLSEADMERRNARLRAAMCAAKARGWTSGNQRESSNYRNRGYATYESNIWPKPPACRVLPDEAWNAEFNQYYDYRSDRSPKKMVKYVSHTHGEAEFHSSWKVASTSFPEYLKCEYGADTFREEPTSAPAKPGALIIATVRDPLARWISAASELLERAINHWCPQGPCTEKDAFIPNVTLSKMSHQTSWYNAVKPAHGGYAKKKLVQLMHDLVHDTKCNFYTYGAEHLSTQSNFVTQNEGRALDIAVIVRLEHLTSGLNHMAHRLGLPGDKISGNCSLQTQNRKLDKPNQQSIPSSAQMMHVLSANTELLHELCLTYAQDYVCFDYDLPEACAGMF